MQPKPTENQSIRGTIGAFNSIRHIGFPHTPELLSVYATLAIVISIISLATVNVGVSESVQLGVLGVILPSVVFALLNSEIFLRSDIILDFRRLMGVELVSLVILSTVLLFSIIIGIIVGNQLLWTYGFLIGIVSTMPVRTFSIITMSERRLPLKIFGAITPPAAIARSYYGILNGILSIPRIASFSSAAMIVFIVGIVLSDLGTLWIVKRVETVGVEHLSYSPMQLFRAFLSHWLGSDPTRLEENLKVLGIKREIDTRILSFKSYNGKIIGSLILSNFHPGPYRDLGSAALPSKLKQFVEEFIGASVHVPHSVSNHELNIVSRENIAKLLTGVKTNYPLDHNISTASQAVQCSSGDATVTGQAFGNDVLLIITLAPHEMEDLPQRVLLEVERKGISANLEVIMVDAHNSIRDQIIVNDKQANSIVEASTTVLQELERMKQGMFAVGFSKDKLNDFSPIDGIGPGGAVASVVKTKSQVSGLITIDGNNMQQGFRQTIIDSLSSLGVSPIEILTTDTHVVTGLARSRLGYYPVGTHVSKPLLVQRIRNMMKRALEDLTPVSAGYSQFNVSVQVLGQATFDSITGFIGNVAKKIARWFYLLELFTLLSTILLLYILV